jgi:hypothetical protein
MTAKFLADVGTIAFSHRFGHEIPHSIGKQRISPQHLNVGRLIDKMPAQSTID